MVKRLVVICSVALLAACTVTTPQKQVQGIDGELFNGNYNGVECEEAFHPSETRSHSMTSLEDMETGVLLAACNWANQGPPRFHPRYAREAHLEFDDRKLSHAEAGQIVWACTVTKSCAQTFEANYGTMLAISETSAGEFVEDLGLSAVYAEIVDIAEMRSELEATGLPRAAIDEFVAVVERSRAHVRAASRDLDEFYEVAVELPLEVFRERQTFFAEQAPLFARLDQLAGSLHQAETLAEIEALRSQYVASCGAFECTSDSFYVEATRMLINGYIAQRDLASAYAENRRLAEDGGYTAGFAQAVYQRQAPAAGQARVAFDRVEEAKEMGLDMATVEATLDARPARFSFSSIANPDLQLPNYTSTLGGPPERQSGFIAGIEDGGDVVTVSFRSSDVKYYEYYDCVETDRVERIHRDGRVEYRTDCSVREKSRTVPGVDPVELPAAEGASLQSGDLMSFYRGPEFGRVYEAYRDEMLIQVRQDAIAPFCRPEMCRAEE